MLIAAALGVLILGFVIGLALQPEQPNLSRDSGNQEQSAQYRPGGSKCEPAEINALAGRKRQARADVCAEAEEQHRETTNGLIEARRAAMAANAQAFFSQKQTGVFAWGIALSLVTMFAAIGAAWYAKRAAEGTEKSASTSLEALNISLTSSRAWIEILPPTIKNIFINTDSINVNIEFFIINTGNSPASSVEIRWQALPVCTKISDNIVN